MEVCSCTDGTPASARYRPKTPPHPRARPQASDRLFALHVKASGAPAVFSGLKLGAMLNCSELWALVEVPRPSFLVGFCCNHKDWPEEGWAGGSIPRSTSHPKENDAAERPKVLYRHHMIPENRYARRLDGS